MNCVTRFPFPFAVVLAALAMPVACESGETPAPVAGELARLQGRWEGTGAGGDCTITVEGNSLQYRTSVAWFKTSIVLTEGTDPKQLRATIKDSGPTEDAIGTEVFVVYKIEDGKLTLTTYEPSDGPPESFGSNNLYVVEKVGEDQGDDATAPR